MSQALGNCPLGPLFAEPEPGALRCEFPGRNPLYEPRVNLYVRWAVLAGGIWLVQQVHAVVAVLQRWA